MEGANNFHPYFSGTPKAALHTQAKHARPQAQGLGLTLPPKLANKLPVGRGLKHRADAGEKSTRAGAEVHKLYSSGMVKGGDLAPLLSAFRFQSRHQEQDERGAARGRKEGRSQGAPGAHGPSGTHRRRRRALRPGAPPAPRGGPGRRDRTAAAAA